MNVLRVYLQLYAECFRKALSAIGKNAWTLLLPGVVLVLRGVAAQLSYRLGLLGGIVMAFANAALFSSYLYFVGELVGGGRVSTKELKRSVGAYLWSIVNVFFVFWVATLLLQLALGRNEQAGALLLALTVVAIVALNAVPEVIYLRGTHGGMQTVAASFDFLKEHWIPWFAVNVPLLAALLVVQLSLALPIVGDFVAGAALHVVMVFRGLLFQALAGSSHRQRMFARRMAG